MKKIFFALVWLVGTSAVAEQSCLMQWDGKVYRPYSIPAQEMAEGLVLKQWVNYRAVNPTAPNGFEDKGANVDFKVLKFMMVEAQPADCKDMPEGTYAYERVTTAAYLEASSEEPVFGSPVDGPNKKTVRAWSLCKGLISKACH